MDPAPRSDRVTLSRDLSEFMVELSIAVHKHAMYPGGHPSLGDAAAGVTRRAERLLEDRPVLVFGVARRQLIIDGVATDPNQPVLRRLAEGLHRHHLGAVTLARGVQPDEMGLALRALSAEVERDGPLGLAPEGRRLEWPHIRLHPLTFDRLELVAPAPGEGGAAAKANARAAELWIGLARAAIATDNTGEAAEALQTEPSSVAKAIDEHHGAAAYDQVIVGYLLQIANELKTATGTEAAMLRRRSARLIGALRPDTLRRLVAMGGDAAQRHEFVLNAANGMALEAVVEILKAAADAGGQTISHGMTRLLSKLAEHAELGSEAARPLAAGALREQVGRLLSGWQLADPNPEAYGRMLQHLATSAPARSTAGALDRSGEQDPLRIVQMSLEVDQSGPLVNRAIDRVMAEGRSAAILKLFASPPAGNSATGAMMARLASPATFAALAAREPLDSDALDQLFPNITLEGYAALLDALAASPNRSTRRKLLDRLGRTGLDVGPLIAARLDDQRWYVVRNMLVLLQRVGRLPPGFSPAPWTRYPDPRVRLEALQLQLMVPAERAEAMQDALEDPDSRVLRLGLTAATQGCPPSIARTVAAIAQDPKAAEDARILAVRALGRSSDVLACNTLIQLVDGGRTLLGRPRLAAPTPICVAAIRALAEGWGHEPAVAPVLTLAAASPDPQLRRAAASGGA